MAIAFHNPKFATIISKDGFHQIQLPDGSILPGVIKTVATDEIDTVPTVTVTMLVNIQSSEESEQKRLDTITESLENFKKRGHEI